MTLHIDNVHLLVQAGNGGNGCESYYHRLDKKVVPNGGDGGIGGRIIFRAASNAPSLKSLRFKQHVIAESGAHGGSNRKRGKNGEDLVITVPVGTRLTDRRTNLLIRELNQDGDEVVVCEGGKGGSGNFGGKEASFGEKGAEVDLQLDARIVADFFLLGLPNSGKSALLRRLTRAAVKEEAYPFSTRSPELGVYNASDYEKLTLCELPSVYGSSHDGKGLGSDFLKHVESARGILFVVEPASQFTESPQEGLKILRKELEMHNKAFLDIPYAVVINKADLMEDTSERSKVSFADSSPVFWVSAMSGEGLGELEHYMKEKAGLDTNA